MAQVFNRSVNTFTPIVLIGLVLAPAGVLGGLAAINFSPWVTQVGVVREQPVPFSHQHHVAGLGLDCRYCHTSVEDSSFAGIPPIKTCMTCHSQIWNQSQMLEPIRESWRTGVPIEWTRVHYLPDFVYFNHSIHVNKGIGCETCHGRVDQMPLMRRTQTLFMAWCLQCHRHPERYIRPREAVFDMGYTYPRNREDVGRRLLADYHVPITRLTNCYVCHR